MTSQVKGILIGAMKEIYIISEFRGSYFVKKQLNLYHDT